MDNRTLIVSVPRSGWIAAAAFVMILSLGVSRAYATFATQLMPFFFADGTEVVATNAGGDAVLNRFFATEKERINWQLMTQYLEPGEQYDIWLEGSNDGSDRFSWWVGRLKATARGDLNGSGIVYVRVPLGPAVGTLKNARAEANLLIRTTEGTTVQTAYFPAF